MADFLQTVKERVVVYDGAFGTYVQTLDLTADDFGGPELEGCNEMLCLTRPDVIAAMHEGMFQAGADVVETASFGSFAVPLGEYGIPEKSYEMSLASARIARVISSWLTVRPFCSPILVSTRPSRTRRSAMAR